MNSGAPLVSVLLPAYDAARTIAEAVASILGQTVDDLEVVVVDDGSTDATVDEALAAAGGDRRLRLIRTEHRGVVEAAQRGLAECRGTFVARMDADDRSLPVRLERQLARFDAEPELSVVSSLVSVLDASADRAGFVRYVDWVNSLVTADDVAREIFVESPLPNPSTMVRRAELEALGGIRETGWPEDYELWLRYHHHGARMAKVPEVLLEWRDSPSRLTRTDPRYSVESFIRAKAHYLTVGPLADKAAVLLWGAGKMGRRLSKHLLRCGVPLVGFVDVDPRKTDGTCRGLPVRDASELLSWLASFEPGSFALVGAVSSHRARALIRTQLNEWELVECRDYWFAA